MYLRLPCLLLLAACTSRAAAPATASGPAPHAPLALTYLGVAGWQIEGAGKTVLVDPYLSRPDPSRPLVPDAAAIAAHTPAHADLVAVEHSHYDHLLDAPSVALRTGAPLLGTISTTRVGRASGLADDLLFTVRGGEDLDLGGFSVRAIPGLHSMTMDPSNGEDIPANPTLPMPVAGYREGGSLAFLFRLGDRQVLVISSANFIEREVDGLRPDVAIIAPGLREKVRDYTCRLLHALGDPPVVLATHFDNWKGPPIDAPSSDAQAFGDEVHRCSPHTRYIVPHHFERIAL